MLEFPRWKTAAILGLTMVVCLAAVPSVLPAAAFAELPHWAQRKVALGYDLRGGGRYQLQVDFDDLRKAALHGLRDDVRGLLREARVGYTGLAIRDLTVEVRIREESDMAQALTQLEILTRPLPRPPATAAPRIYDSRPSVTARRGAVIPPPEVVMDVADRLVRLSATEAALLERATRARDRGAELIARRLGHWAAPYTVERIGADRIFVETFDPTEQWRWMSH